MKTNSFSRKKEFSLNQMFIGSSENIESIRDLFFKAAMVEETTLITGETGTGKEIVARLIHKKSQRHKKPFIVVNCAAIPEGLAESELFGYEKGTFTNAFDQKEGKFLLADKGIIFLDEISSLSFNIQGKILRVLQEKEVQKIGSARSKKVDLFIIAATNVNLREAVRQGKFREDLFYRLNIISINLPPLRKRKDDLEILADHFLIKHENLNHRKKICPGTMKLFRKYSWPGNVRQFENLLKSAICLNDVSLITKDNLPSDFIKEVEEEIIRTKGNFSLKKALLDHEKEVIERVLSENEFDLTEISKILKIKRGELQSKIKKHGIRLESSRRL